MPECPDCGASRQCGAGAVRGYNYCGSHGGPNPRNNFWGIGVGIKTGVKSMFPLTRLAAKYNEQMQNGRFLSNRHSLDVIRTRISQLLERIDQNEAPDRLKRLYVLWERYKEQQAAGMSVEAVGTKRSLDEEFEKAYHDYAAWEQMFTALDLDRKMVESEVKIAKEINAILTAEEAYELTAKLMAAIISAVGAAAMDQSEKGRLLNRVQFEFTRIVGDGIDEESAERIGGSAEEVIDA